MKPALVAAIALGASLTIHAAVASPGPGAPAASMPLPGPKDRPYAGEIQLSVDATDLDRRIVHVRERVSGITADTVLLYPKWLPGTHAPEGPIDRLGGLQISAHGRPLAWATT